MIRLGRVVPDSSVAKPGHRGWGPPQRSPSPRDCRPLRRTSVWPTHQARRVCLAWLLAGVLVVLALGACGDNAVPRGVAAPGASGNVGSLKLRDAVLSDPGADAEFPGYDRGEDALLLVTIVNDGDTDDELVSVTTAAAKRVTIQGATTIPAGGSVSSIPDADNPLPAPV